MRFKFDPSLQHQQDGIDGSVSVFDGQPHVQTAQWLSCRSD